MSEHKFESLVSQTPNSPRHASEEWWQQMLGRTHRSGQLADEVHVRVYAPTERARERVLAARRVAQQLTNATKEPRKLALADLEQE